MLRRLNMIAAVLGLLVGAGTYWFLWAAAGPKPGPHTIIVEEGSTLGSVAQQLEIAGAIPGSARTYRMMARIFGSGDPVQAGEFEVPKGTGGAAAGVIPVPSARLRPHWWPPSAGTPGVREGIGENVQANATGHGHPRAAAKGERARPV